MAKNPLKRTERKKFLGTFSVGEGASEVGELTAAGKDTVLTLHASKPLRQFEGATTIHGHAFTGERLSLIGCAAMGDGTRYAMDGDHRYHAHVFPHYVVTGEAPLEPDDRCIEELEFTTGDLRTLFDDHDAYGTALGAERLMEKILEEERNDRHIEIGKYPVVAYYTGKRVIVSTTTAIGQISAEHRPSRTFGGTKGVHLKNRIVVTVRPTQPMSFHDAMRHMGDVLLFLSMCAGRIQNAREVRLMTTQRTDGIPIILTVRPSLSWTKRSKNEAHAPHPGDLPLDPIRHADEFRTVLSTWMQQHDERHVARCRHLGSLRKGSSYSPDRIVAAANVFDILPPSAVPEASELPPELADAVAQCRDLLRGLPQSGDRDGALSALGRLGKPSLPKKVSSRARLVAANISGLTDLEWVGSIAVKCRNFFVHGGSADFDYDRVDGFMPFLTDSLEFIFAASDLIDAGWEARRWASNMHGSGHSFARFRREYARNIEPLRATLRMPARR